MQLYYIQLQYTSLQLYYIQLQYTSLFSQYLTYLDYNATKITTVCYILYDLYRLLQPCNALSFIEVTYNLIHNLYCVSNFPGDV